MAAKDVKFSRDARERILRGVDILADAVKVTLGRSADDPQDVGFLHDDQLFAVDLDLGARPFAEQDLVASLDVERGDRAVLGAGPGADGDDFAFLRLFLGRIGNDDPAGGFSFSLDPADENSIVKRPECHVFSPLSSVENGLALRVSSASDREHVGGLRGFVNGSGVKKSVRDEQFPGATNEQHCANDL